MCEKTFAGGEEFAFEAAQLWDVGGRGGRRFIEDFAQNPRATFNGTGMLAVAAHPVDGRHSKQPSARRIRWQFYNLKLVTNYAGQFIEMGKQSVHHHVV